MNSESRKFFFFFRCVCMWGVVDGSEDGEVGSISAQMQWNIRCATLYLLYLDFFFCLLRCDGYTQDEICPHVCIIRIHITSTAHIHIHTDKNYIYIYIYIYVWIKALSLTLCIYSHPPKDCFVVSQLISVAI